MSVVHSVASTHPELAGYFTAPGSGEVISEEDFLTIKRVTSAIQATGASLHLPELHDAAQVWVYRFANALTLPAAAAMIEEEKYPSLDLSTCRITWMDPLWYTIEPLEAVESIEDVARTYVRSVGKIIGIVSQIADLKPAPLWALAMDSPVGGLVRYGVQDFAPGEGCEAADEFWRVMCTESGHKLPPPHYEVLTGGTFARHGIDADDDGSFVEYFRSSCCKIFRSPDADICSDCPRRGKETLRKEAAQRARFA